MNTMDLVMMIFLFLGAFQGFGSGFVRTLSSWASPLIALIAVNKGLASVLKLLPSAFQHRIGVIFVALIVFIVVYFVVNIIGRALKHIVNFSLLGSADHIAGLFLGIVSSAILVGLFVALGMQFSIIKNATPLALFLAGHSAQTLRFLLGS